MLPRDVFFIRHGQSEGNVAVSVLREYHFRKFPDEFQKCHSAHYRLSNRGKRQAIAAGKWLKNWLREKKLPCFDHHFVSEYARAMETAAFLHLPNAKWRADYQLRERDYGVVGVFSEDGQREILEEDVGGSQHSFYTRFPQGESIADVDDRLRGSIIDTLCNECGNQRAVIVTHGEVMQVLRVIFEGISAESFQKSPTEKERKIGNGQILHYTTANPWEPMYTAPSLSSFGWVRSINPYDPDYAGHEWKEIRRPTYSNGELWKSVRRFPRLLLEETPDKKKR